MHFKDEMGYLIFLKNKEFKSENDNINYGKFLNICLFLFGAYNVVKFKLYLYIATNRAFVSMFRRGQQLSKT